MPAINIEVTEIDELQDSKPKPQIVKIKNFIFSYYDFRINGYTQEIEYRAKLDEDNQWKILDDFSFNDLVYYLKESGFGNKITDDLKVILFSSQVSKFWAIEQYFKALPPDSSTDEIDRWCNMLILKNPDQIISYHTGGIETSVTYQEAKRSLLKKWLIACCQSALGWKPNDVMLILISDQGKYKTSFLNYLCPPSLSEYLFTGHITPSITENITANFLAEKFFINIDDQLETIFGKEFNSMKAIISADSVTNRKVYRKFSPKRKRIANFMGSVNNPSFLSDNENRRYLCLEIEQILPEYNTINIDRLWAQAYQLARKTGIYETFTGTDRLVISAISKQFITPTTEHEYLTTLFKPANDNGDEELCFMKASEILQCISAASGNKNVNLFRLNIALKREGFLRKSKRLQRLDNMPVYVYILMPKQNTDKLLRNASGIDINQFRDRGPLLDEINNF